jgi:hypothetical protein
MGNVESATYLAAASVPEIEGTERTEGEETEEAEGTGHASQRRNRETELPGSILLVSVSSFLRCEGLFRFLRSLRLLRPSALRHLRS